MSASVHSNPRGGYMARKDVDLWWAEGRAVSDILYCMENRAPNTWLSNPENMEEYRRYVEITCETTRSENDLSVRIKNAYNLLKTLLDDKYSYTPPKFQGEMAELIEMAENLLLSTAPTS